MTQPTLHAPKLSRKEKYGYGIGAMGEGMAFNLVSSFFMIYCTDSLGISAGFIATFFFAARIWDALNDIMMGTLAENIHTKWGKHRPWILLGALLNAAVLVLLFNPTLARAGNVHLYIVVFYVLFDMTYTIIDVPYYAYAAAFTDAHERDQISAIPRILGGVGTIGIPALTLMMVQKLSPESQAQGFFQRVGGLFWPCAHYAVLAGSHGLHHRPKGSVKQRKALCMRGGAPVEQGAFKQFGYGQFKTGVPGKGAGYWSGASFRHMSAKGKFLFGNPFLSWHCRAGRNAQHKGKSCYKCMKYAWQGSFCHFTTLLRPACGVNAARQWPAGF